jgi:glutamate dehydrogenase
MIQATLRTNYFVTKPNSARQQNVLSVKLNPGLIDELPLPRPKFEIFVYSPRVEGVHLRFGHVARGGLRWSDRREDFRTDWSRRRR